MPKAFPACTSLLSIALLLSCSSHGRWVEHVNHFFTYEDAISALKENAIYLQEQGLYLSLFNPEGPVVCTVLKEDPDLPGYAVRYTYGGVCRCFWTGAIPDIEERYGEHRDETCLRLDLVDTLWVDLFQDGAKDGDPVASFGIPLRYDEEEAPPGDPCEGPMTEKEFFLSAGIEPLPESAVGQTPEDREEALLLNKLFAEAVLSSYGIVMV